MKNDALIKQIRDVPWVPLSYDMQHCFCGGWNLGQMLECLDINAVPFTQILHTRWRWIDPHQYMLLEINN